MFNINELKNFLITNYDSNKNNIIDLDDNLPSWLKCLFSSDGTLDYEQLYNTLRNNNIKSLYTSVFNQIQLPETDKKQDNKPFDISLIKDKIKFNLKWTPSDGKIGQFKQGHSGDCYFLASLQAISNTANGQQIIRDSISQNNGSYRVKFAGAIKVKNNIEEQIKNKQIRGKCFVSGIYTITQNEIKAAQKENERSGKYSTGDLDILILELALEKYRRELKLTRDSSPDLKNLSIQTAENAGSGNSYNNAMNGGHGFDAMFLLTGEKSLYWHTDKNQNQIKPYVKGKYQQISRQDFLTGKYSIENTKSLSLTVETYGVTTGDKERSRRLTALEGHRKDFAITVGVNYKTEKSSGWHEITVEKITPQYVFVSNPHDNNIIEIVPRAEFEQMIDEISACPTKNKNSNNNFYNKIQQVIQQLDLRKK